MLILLTVGWLLQQQAIILGMTSGKDLAQVCRQEYSLVPKVIVFLMTELVIIGSDIQEVRNHFIESENSSDVDLLR